MIFRLRSPQYTSQWPVKPLIRVHRAYYGSFNALNGVFARACNQNSAHTDHVCLHSTRGIHCELTSQAEEECAGSARYERCLENPQRIRGGTSGSVWLNSSRREKLGPGGHGGYGLGNYGKWHNGFRQWLGIRNYEWHKGFNGRWHGIRNCGRHGIRNYGRHGIRSCGRHGIRNYGRHGYISSAPGILIHTRSLVAFENDRGGRTSTNSLTPLYSQIKKIMEQNPGCVCLVQVGGFYELYFEQATIYGPKLGIKVATRSSGPYSVPMSGFPVHQLKKFVKMLVSDLSETVAIVDQRASVQNTIHRRVSRIISPGTLVDESFVNFDQNNYLLAINLPPLGPGQPDIDTAVGLSWIDMSVGEFYVQQTTLSDLVSQVSRINPSEIVMGKEHQEHALHQRIHGLQPLRRYFTRYHKTDHSSKVRFKATPQQVRKCLETLSVREEAAMNMVLSYIGVNFPEASVDIELPVQYRNEKVLHMDASTREALELTERSSGGRNLQMGTLLSTIRRTKTPSGNRLLTQWIKSPSLDIDELTRRQDFVAMFLSRGVLRAAVRNALEGMGDVSRHLQRLSFDTGDTVDNLLGVKDGLNQLHAIEQILRDEVRCANSKMLTSFLKDFEVPKELIDRIGSVLETETGTRMDEETETGTRMDEETETGTRMDEETESDSSILSYSSLDKYKRVPKKIVQFQIKRDTTPELEELHKTLDEVRARSTAFVATLAESLEQIDPKTTVTAKQSHGRFSNVLHISCKSKSVETVAKALKSGVVDRRKTSLLYKPAEWRDVQDEMDGILDRIQLLEQEVLRSLRDEVLAKSTEIRRHIKLADYLDVTCSFAVVAEEGHFVRPRFLKTPSLRIRGGRHIVVENGLRNSETMFAPNDTALTPANNLWVITGPNMGGKSTFLRQNAIIVILAQIGSFVPAEKASLGIVDSIFTRIGASDDLFNDMSTFMVEMVQTSNILRNATSRSLAIVDEIGRGTSGKEGLAIAYAVLLNLLVGNKCRTLFATHFGHEIQSLLAKNKVDGKKIAYYRTRVLADEGADTGLIMDHTLERGISERSYAFEVAQMAGFPREALENAKKALEVL